jgi:hypothetical protein
MKKCSKKILSSCIEEGASASLAYALICAVRVYILSPLDYACPSRNIALKVALP